VMKRVVESATGSTAFFLQGACGDIGPVRGVARNGQHEYRRLGSMLGHEASRVWWELEVPGRAERYVGTLESGSPLAIYADEPLPEAARHLRVISRTVDLPTKQVGDLATFEAESAAHIARLNELRAGGGDPEEIRRATMLAKRATMRAGLARDLEGTSERAVEIQGFALDSDIALLAISAEPFAELGLRIKADSPFASTLVSGYSNIHWAYLPTASAYPLGGYEIEVTPFAPEAADLMVEACLSLLRELRG